MDVGYRGVRWGSGHRVRLGERVHHRESLLLPQDSTAVSLRSGSHTDSQMRWGGSNSPGNMRAPDTLAPTETSPVA